LLREDFKHYRDELIISSKAGWDMWPGPYGQGGGSRKYVLASLDQSLQRLGVDYVDIFYSHRFDPTPRWKKPPAPSPPPCNRARRCTSASRPTPG
jgi:aryl-alcohol dehydrogenase-like predicted oxidoreductase